MYRAKVESVSGINVRAGGKWLTCIGNKTVRVGDYVWTDGRCVYGNNRVSQQPLVITAAPDDEVIPIITDKGYYAFSKKKGLKVIKKIQIGSTYEDPDIPGEYIREEPMMINDFTSQVYLGDVSKARIDGGNIYNYLLAINIDEQGNRYEMIQSFKWDPHYYGSGSDDGERLNPTVNILKNGAVIQSIPVDGATGGFIENENNWRFFIIDVSPYVLDGNTDVVYTADYILYTNAGKYILMQVTTEHRFYGKTDGFRGFHDVNIFDTEISATEVIIGLQEGYYFKLRFLRTAESVFHNPATEWGYLTTTEKNSVYIADIFSPQGELIMTNPDIVFSRTVTSFLENSVLGAIKKIGSLYLINSNAELIHSGSVKVVKNGVVTDLNIGKCFNQFFRPMKHYKNWEKRIQELTF